MKKLLLILGLVSACTTVGPDYERPEFPVPGAFRGEGVQADDAASFGDVAWFDLFGDPALQGLIRRALKNNYDVRIAAERILEVRARLTIIKSDAYPTVDASLAKEWNRLSRSGGPGANLPAGIDLDNEQWSLGIGLTWEVDFWGKVRRASEAGLAELLASELSRRAVIQSLVADLAVAYFELIELDAELEITQRELESRQTSLRLVTLRLEQGVSTKLEQRQAENLVWDAAGLVPDLEQRIEQQENLIQFLIGDNPGDVKRGRPLLEQNREIAVPAGIPSAILERRPDIRIAEENLVAANARIGEAKALLYPSIGLTASGGVASRDLKDLFSNDTGFYAIKPFVTVPIFNAGRLRANVKVTESQQRQAAMNYLQAIQQAFREVADGLIVYEKTREVRGFREKAETTLSDQARLSELRYRGGVTGYLEVLDSKRDHLDAELRLAQSLRNELLSIVLLYRALGGGWQGAEEEAAAGEQVGASGLVAAPTAH